MQKVLITGGAGFIGTRLVTQLLATGYSVRVLDPLATQIHGAVPTGLDWLNGDDIEYHRGTVTSRADIERSLDGVTQIVHLAAETGTGQSMYEIGRYNEVNSQGTAMLLDVLTNTPNHSVERIVLSSSRSVYGEGAYVCRTCDGGLARIFPKSRTAEQLALHRWEHPCQTCGNDLEAVPTCETDPVRPASVYAATKYAQEDLIRVACESVGIGYAILRFQNVYGEGQSLRNPYTGILSIMSTRARRGLPLTIFEDGLESRDFVHVDDVVCAVRHAMQTTAPANQVVNVGSGTATSVMEIATLLSRALGVEPNLRVTAEYRLGDIRHNIADVSRMKTVLYCHPAISPQEGIQRFADWVLTQSLPADLLDQANAELRSRGLMG